MNSVLNIVVRNPAFVLCSLLLACNSLPSASPGGSIDPIFALNTSKARAEKAVLDLSALNNADISAAESAYEDARAKWNGWLNTLVFAISTGQNVDSWPAHEDAATEASDATNTFLARAEELLGSSSTLVTDPLSAAEQSEASSPPTVGSAPTVGIDPVTASATLITIGLQLWEGWQGVERDRRLIYVEALERLKWQSFDAIAGKTISSNPPQLKIHAAT